MVVQKMRSVMVASGVAAMLLAVPAESMACGLFDCLFGWCGSRTTYRVAYPMAASTPAPYASPSPCATQTCRYVPQTSYRTVCERVPVTTSQAVTSRDPCTGCPVTTYRPITTWTTRTRLVPYATYRLTWSPAYVATPACAPGGPTYSTAADTASSCCTPSLSSPAPVQMTPSTSPTTPAEVPSTFQNGQGPATEQRIEPTPDPNSDATSAGPSIFPDRTTSLPVVRRASYYQLISTPSSRPAPAAPPRQTPLNDGGWRASRN